MDSKTVNREIRRTIWPTLERAGFSAFTSRTAWRRTETRVEVLNFQSFNSYLASSLGCTTYSFSVNLGSYLLEVPATYPIKEKDGNLLPAEYHCHLRGHLHRTFEQAECSRRDIWYIDSAGHYLQTAINDVRELIPGHALAWYDSLRDSAHVLSVLLTQREDADRLWGFGANPSPIRSYASGYIALALGRNELAKAKLEYALQSGCFESVASRIAADIKRLA